MTLTATEKSYIWLNSFPLTEGEKRKLLALAEDAVALVRNFPTFQSEMIKFGKESVYNNMQATLSDGGKYFSKLVDRLEKEGITPVVFQSDEYPNELKTLLSDPPLVLYAKGDISLLKTRKFTVVGSRQTTPAAVKIGRKISQTLSNRFTLITGTADGGDSAAIEGGLTVGKIIAVAAGGLDVCLQSGQPLLSEVAKKGLLLSPYPLSTPVRTFSYEYRNKILAALGEGTLVLGAGEKSGALTTAKYAKEFQKKLFALPYAPGTYAGAGCNALIKQGATLTESAEDVFSQFGEETLPFSEGETPFNAARSKPAQALTADEEKVLQALRGLGETHLSALLENVALPVYKLTAILSSLEVKGLATKLGGNRYAPL